MRSTLPIGSYKTIQRPAALPHVEIQRGRAAPGAGGGGFFTQYAVSAGDGPIRLHHRGKQYEFSGRYVVLVDPGDFIPTYACGGPIDFQTWCFDSELMRRAAEERGSPRKPQFAWGIAPDDRLHSLIVQTTFALARTRDSLAQQERLTELLDTILGGYVGNSRPVEDVIAHRAVRRMRDLIHDGYNRELSLDLLASRASLNKFYALRAFKRAFGVTPHEYQRHLRLSKSRELLLAGHNGAEIAQAIGFCDQSHFVRTFRQFHFITPRRYQVAG